jgi:hypothetical protein
MSIYLNCECGNQVLAEEASAGASVPCSCGRAVAVPSLGQLRHLSQEVGIMPASQVPGSGQAAALPMDSHQTTEQAVSAIYQFAALEMHNGTPDSEIARKLRDQGFDADTANLVVDQTRAARGQVMREAGMKNMFIGGIVCVIGLVITVASYSAAANNPGGGSYVIAWGAVVFGAIQFFRGIFQMGTR